MTWQIVLGFIVLLLPAAFALLVRVNGRTNSDPYIVRRARYSAVLFPVFVAMIYALQFVFLLSLERERQADLVLSASGLFVWAVIAWILLASLIYGIRKPTAEHLARSTSRAATLEPRHKNSPIPAWAWLMLAGSLGAATIFIEMTLSPVPGTSWVLLISAAAVLALGPWLVHQNLLAAEPNMPDTLASVRSAYRRRRQIRSWWLYSVFAISVCYKTLLAALIALDRFIADALYVSTFGAALIILNSAVFYVFDRRRSRSIVRLMNEV